MEVVGNNMAGQTQQAQPTQPPPRFMEVTDQSQLQSLAVAEANAEEAAKAAAGLAISEQTSQSDDDDMELEPKRDLTMELGSKMRFRASASMTARAKANSGCSGHGLFQNGVCFCNPGFEGPDCSVAVVCPDDCSGHGICKYGQCFCEPDWAGGNCGERANIKRSFPQVWITAILSVLTFFVGIIVGRKTLKKEVADMLEK